MLTSAQILKLFSELNDGLRQAGETGEIGIVGGAVMCLVYQARPATRDVDAIFEPSSIIRKIAKKIADAHNLPDDWLNDAAKAYVRGDFARQTVLNLSNLRVWAPEPRYMLAMKCISARWDTSDRDDVILLLEKLQLRRAKDVFAIIEHYYPKKQIPAKTQFLIEELLET